LAPKLVSSPEHRARELIHGIMLVSLCMKCKGQTVAEMQKWKQWAATSRRKLESLYSNGLDRNFRDARTDIGDDHSASSPGADSLTRIVLIPEAEWRPRTPTCVDQAEGQSPPT
jgi:hypothetical protein